MVGRTFGCKITKGLWGFTREGGERVLISDG